MNKNVCCLQYTTGCLSNTVKTGLKEPCIGQVISLEKWKDNLAERFMDIERTINVLFCYSSIMMKKTQLWHFIVDLLSKLGFTHIESYMIR